MNEPAKWKRPRKARWIVLGVLGGIVLFAVGVFLEAWISAGSLLKRERESVVRRAAELGGKPIRHVAIIGTATPGESWREFERVRTELNSLSTTDLETFPTLSGDEFPILDDEAIDGVLRKMDPAMDALDLALRQEGTEAGIELGDPLSQDLLSTMIQLARMLTDSAASRHRQGDGAGALRHLGRASDWDGDGDLVWTLKRLP